MAKPSPRKTVQVHYIGGLADDTRFSSDQEPPRRDPDELAGDLGALGKRSLEDVISSFARDARELRRDDKGIRAC